MEVNLDNLIIRNATINDIKQNGGTFVTCGSFYLAGEVRGYLLENKNI